MAISKISTLWFFDGLAMRYFAPFPFLRYTIVFMAGIALYLYFGFYSPWLWALLGINLVGFAWAYSHKNTWQHKAYSGILGLMFLLQTGYLITHNNTPANKPQHYRHFLPQATHYQAVVNTLVEERKNSWKATAKITKLIKNSQSIDAQGDVLLYFDKAQIQRPNYGDVLLVAGQPKLIDGPKNPYEFDYQQYLSYQGVYYQHFLRDSSFVTIGHSTPNFLMALAYRANGIADSLITNSGAEKQEYGVANAMILGLRDDLDPDLMQAYSVAGAIHVLSVSGLHVGVIYAVLLLCLSPLVQKKWLSKWTFFGLIFAILWFYAFVTGLSSPVLRSTVMFSFILLAQTLGRQQNSFNVVAISAFCLLVYQPYFLANVGFQLSYLAVFGMIFFQPLLNPILQIDKSKNRIYWLADRLWKVTTVAIAAQIATFPITIYYFHQFPNWFLLANPIVILLSSVALCVGLAYLFLAWVPLLGGWVAALLNFSILALNKSVTFTEQMPLAISKWLSIKTWEMLLLYALIGALMALWASQKSIWLYLGLGIVAVLIAYNFLEPFIQQKQALLVVHAIPKHSVLSVVEGRKAKILADEDFLKSKADVRYRLGNFWAAKGITDTLQTNSDNNTKGYQWLVWKGKVLLIIRKNSQGQLRYSSNQIIDYLIVSNKSIKKLAQLSGLNFKVLLIDGSNGFYQSHKLALEAQAANIPCKILTETGALVLEE